MPTSVASLSGCSPTATPAPDRAASSASRCSVRAAVLLVAGCSSALGLCAVSSYTKRTAHVLHPCRVTPSPTAIPAYSSRYRALQWSGQILGPSEKIPGGVAGVSLTISAGTDWSKVHVYQNVHELCTRAHRAGSQRSTKGQTSQKSKCFGWQRSVEFFATRPAREVEGPSAQPAFELQLRACPSGMEKYFGRVQWESIEAQWS